MRRTDDMRRRSTGATVRPLEAADEEAVYRLWQESVVADNPIARQLDRWGPGIAVPIDGSQDPNLIETPPEPGHAVRRVLSELIAGGDSYACFVAIGPDPIGFIVGSIESNPLFVGEIGSVDVLFVSDRYRRQGVGTELVGALEGWFHHRAIHQLRAGYDRGQRSAHRFWHAQPGWAPTGETARCHG